MFHLSTVSLKDLLKDYGPIIPATATIVAATVAAFAARAAMRSAQASEDNVETAKISMELGNRAYVSVITTKFVQEIAPGNVPRASVTVKNVGKTPAKVCILRFDLEYVAAQFGRDIPDPPLDEGEFALAPAEEKTFVIFASGQMDRERLAALHNETLFLNFWGRLVYQDVFGKGHETTWCTSYNTNSPTKLVLNRYGNDMT
jgi:hypothetical protein